MNEDTLRVRCTSDFKKRLSAVAKRENRNVSNMALQILNEYADGRAPARPTPPDSARSAEGERAIRAMGEALIALRVDYHGESAPESTRLPKSWKRVIAALEVLAAEVRR